MMIAATLFYLFVQCFNNQIDTLTLTHTDSEEQAYVVEDMLNSDSLNPVSQQAKQESFGHEYFPLHSHYRYIYASNAGDTDAEIKKLDRESILIFNGPNITYKQSYLRKTDGIHITRTQTSAFYFFGNDICYNEPALRLPLPLKIGSKWKWEGYESDENETGRLVIHGQALGIETIETAAGKFECLKISLTIHSIGGAKNSNSKNFDRFASLRIINKLSECRIYTETQLV